MRDPAIHLVKSLDQLGPGRETDVELAIMLFGWRWITEDPQQPTGVPYLVAPDGTQGFYFPKEAAKHPETPGAGGDMPMWSTDGRASWMLIDRMAAAGWILSLEGEQGWWSAHFFRPAGTAPAPGSWPRSEGETRAGAIAHAALTAVEVESDRAAR